MTYSELRALNNINPGDVVWAYEFTLTQNKSESYLSSKPTIGRVMCGRSQAQHDSKIQQGKSYLGYFVPFKKGKEELAWSKAVELSSRRYALTEEECITLYNQRVDKAVKWLRDRANECEAMKIQ